MNETTAIALVALVLVAAVVIALAIRFYVGRRADERWTAGRYPPLTDIGAVQHLTILPLIDRKPARPGLVGEAGVSYLVQADQANILFDVGLNGRQEHPSPLIRNMQALGVTLAQVHYIVISHLHSDHVGGFTNQWKRTFDLSSQPADLGAIRAIAPTLMIHSTARVEVADRPRVIAPGVATLGPIPRQLFWFGWTPEQALAVNVEGKGIVLIIGCGHPRLQRIVQQAEALFDLPIYGIVGGLHYPVTGLPVQRFLGTDSWPWAPATRKDVGASIAFLQQRHPRLVAISAHDSCDWTIECFRQAFSQAYQDILVGKEIIV